MDKIDIVIPWADGGDPEWRKWCEDFTRKKTVIQGAFDAILDEKSSFEL